MGRAGLADRQAEAIVDHWDAARLARELLEAHGLSDWGFAFNGRKRAMGLCHYQRKRIELSRHFVWANDEPAIRQTLLHEIAHALAGPEAGHGPRWRGICRRIGARPERLGSAAMPAGQWVAVCPACGRRHERHRRPPSGYDYACRQCGHEKGPLRFQRRTGVSH
jgi:predicted SprT family Zn-dependent metalloprotease